MKNKLILGIDTSNYTTSLALTRGEKIIIDCRRILKVKEGNCGLRQSDAFFNHIRNLEEMLPPILERYAIDVVAYSDRPRNIEGSYMPVFRAGGAFAKTVAASLRIPIYKFSHQEGHISAGLWQNNLSCPFIAFHLSGGTLEILKVDKNNNIQIIGETKDISYGQLIDRVGVRLGFSFPAGEELDKLAVKYGKKSKISKKIFIKDLDLNISGIETYLLNVLDSQAKEEVIATMFTEIAESLLRLTNDAFLQYNIKEMLMIGGVSSSKFIQEYFDNKNETVKVYFAKDNLASDNAVGIALLGGKAYGLKTD